MVHCCGEAWEESLWRSMASFAVVVKAEVIVDDIAPFVVAVDEVSRSRVRGSTLRSACGRVETRG